MVENVGSRERLPRFRPVAPLLTVWVTISKLLKLFLSWLHCLLFDDYVNIIISY